MTSYPRSGRIRAAIAKSKAFFPYWSRTQRTAWVRGYLTCERLNKVPHSTRWDEGKFLATSTRVTGWPYGTKFHVK